MRMHQLLPAFIVMALTLPHAAKAENGDGWYTSAALTISQLQDTDGTIANAPMPGITVQTENGFESGFGGLMAIGRDFGKFRLEVEGGYIRDTQNEYTAVFPPTGRIVADVKQETLRVMANGYVDISDGPIQPFVGAGLGLAKVDLLFVGPRAPFPSEAPRTLIDDSDSRLAYQLMAGLAVPVSNKLAITLQYRWFDAGTIKLLDTRNEQATRNIAGHHLDAGLRLRF